MALHSDQINLNQVVGENIRLAGTIGLLTNQNVIDATTWTDLQNSIDTNARALHADVQNYAVPLKRALDIGHDDGTLSDAAIQAATGYDNLASLTQSAPGITGPLALG
jgi:hypothetical protein